MRFLGCGTPPLTKHSLLCWPVSGIWRLASSPGSKPYSLKIGIQGSSARHLGWARCGGLSICHLALQRQWRCRHRRHREVVHEAGRGWRQYGVEMAEQRRVSAFAWEGHTWAPLLDLAHLGVNRCRLRHRCAAISCVQATTAAAAWKKGGFEFLCFAAKTVGCAVKWWNSHRVLK
jgi:hypothetical protein